MTELAERLIEIRHDMGLTQREMADFVQVSSGAWQGYEYGKVPKADTLKRLVECGYNANWILSGEGPMLTNINEGRDKLIWNVAFFLCQRCKLPYEPSAFADTYLDIYEWMSKNNKKDAKDRQHAEVTAEIIDFAVKRMTSK